MQFASLGNCPKVIKFAQSQASVCQCGLASEVLARGRCMHMCRAGVFGSSQLPGETPLPERLTCQHCFTGHFLKLTAHSPVQSNCPGVPVGAVARPTRGPAWLSLTMWQAWMAAHSRASSQCCLPRSQMLPLEKIASQFEILVL